MGGHKVRRSEGVSVKVREFRNRREFEKVVPSG